MDAVVVPGIGWLELNDILKPRGLCFPLDPGPGATTGGECHTLFRVTGSPLWDDAGQCHQLAVCCENFLDTSRPAYAWNCMQMWIFDVLPDLCTGANTSNSGAGFLSEQGLL